MISLNHSLFQINPDERFSQEYSVPMGTLTQLCSIEFVSQKRTGVIIEWFNLKYNKNLTLKILLKWRKRREVYLLTESLRRKRTQQIPIEWFGKHAPFVKYTLTQYPKGRNNTALTNIHTIKNNETSYSKET